MRKIILAVLITLFATSAAANKPDVPYEEHPKYAKILCILAGIPVNMCHRKAPKK